MAFVNEILFYKNIFLRWKKNLYIIIIIITVFHLHTYTYLSLTYLYKYHERVFLLYSDFFDAHISFLYEFATVIIILHTKKKKIKKPIFSILFEFRTQTVFGVEKLNVLTRLLSSIFPCDIPTKSTPFWYQTKNMYIICILYSV